jgi:hypothetical protein
LQFFKYGALQGSTDIQGIHNKIKENLAAAANDKNIRKIQALMYKYAQTCNTALEAYNADKHHESPTLFSSELTDYLKKNFGLEFVFFAAKGKEKPYGYAIIDHKNRRVYKGSEVMALDYLTGLSANAAIPDKKTSEMNNNPSAVNNDTQQNTFTPAEKNNAPTSNAVIDLLLPDTIVIPTKPKHFTEEDEEDLKKKKRRRI